MSSGPSTGERGLEVLAALILGVATLGSAWCVFQASRWNDQEGDDGRAAIEARLDASRLFTLGAQKIAYDANITAQYAQAVADGREDLQQFYKENLVRPDFLPVLEAWEEQVATDASSASNLLQNEEYIDAQLTESREADEVASAASESSEEASRHADRYVQSTIFMATALFFAGVTSNFRGSYVRLFLIAAAVLAVAVGASQLVEIPIA